MTTNPAATTAPAAPPTNGSATTRAPVPTKPAAPASKLSRVVRGKLAVPFSMVVYGPEACGKSTFAGDAPTPIFICRYAETARLDVERYPDEPQSWPEVLAAINDVTNNPSQYKTVVFDTLDWLEILLQKHVCQKNGWDSISSPGYGKGEATALLEWDNFLSHLERLRAKRNVNLIFVCHANVNTFKNPEGENYGRFGMKIDSRAAAKMREWCDVVLLFKVETFALKQSKFAAAKGTSSGRTIVRTKWTAAYDAKNRYGLPDPMECSYAEFAGHVDAFNAIGDPVKLRAEIADLTAQLASAPAELFNAAGFAKALVDAGDHGDRLKRLADRLREKVDSLAKASEQESPPSTEASPAPSA